MSPAALYWIRIDIMVFTCLNVTILYHYSDLKMCKRVCSDHMVFICFYNICVVDYNVTLLLYTLENTSIIMSENDV